MVYEFVERTLDQFLMIIDGSHEGARQPVFREPIAKSIIEKRSLHRRIMISTLLSQMLKSSV